MTKLIDLAEHIDSKGSLTVIGKELGFEIKRVFFITNVPEAAVRGQHMHYSTITGLICVAGSCEVVVKSKKVEKKFILNKKNECLIIEPNEWRKMQNFSPGTVLLAIVSTDYDRADYIV